MEDKIAHLGMVQGVISRMAQNSFAIKGWSVTLVAALFALAAVDANPAFVYLAYLPVVTFWTLDAYFLRQERLFRALFNEIRAQPKEDVDFSMDTEPFAAAVAGQGTVFWSRTLVLFHGTVLFAVLSFTALSIFRSW